jgi:hypothetical protein
MIAWLIPLFPAALALAAPSPSPLAASAAVPDAWIGVLREDGRIQPLFLFRADGSWSAPWPGPDDSDSLASPRPMGQVPGDWSGGRPELLREWKSPQGKILRPVRFSPGPAHCLTVWGLETSAAGRPQSPPIAPVRVPVTTGAITLRAFGPRAKLRRAALARAKRWFKADPRGGALRLVDLRCVELGPGDPLCHVRIERKLDGSAPAKDAGCGQIQVADGWLRGRALAAAGHSLQLTDCDRVKYEGQAPLGAFSRAGRVYLLLETSGYEASAYALGTLQGSSIELLSPSVSGGGC